MTTTRTVPDVLQRARELVAAPIRASVDRLSDEVRRLVEYHLGYVDRYGRPESNESGGKGLRPALAILSAEAAGCPAAVGIPGAVSVELVHNFSLLHDDVIDCDRERRHRPTVWALFGIGPAIIAGDALLALAQEIVLEAPRGGSEAGRCLAEATGAMINGQALDMAFESALSVDVDSCITMEAGKTGALLGCAASIGAILGGAKPEVVSALKEFGIQLGLAFQAVDDLLGIWGDPETTGKPAWSDLRQHKKTLPVTAALAAGDSAAAELASLFRDEHLDDVQVARAAHLVELCGGRAIAMDEARGRLAAALASIDGAPLDPNARRELREVAGFVVAREF